MRVDSLKAIYCLFDCFKPHLDSEFWVLPKMYFYISWWACIATNIPCALHFIFLLHDAYIIYTQADIDTATHPAHTFNVCCRNRFRPPTLAWFAFLACFNASRWISNPCAYPDGAACKKIITSLMVWRLRPPLHSSPTSLLVSILVSDCYYFIGIKLCSMNMINLQN